jgi:hypothetical protein
VLFPDQKWIGAILILIAVGVFVFDVRIEDWHFEISQLEPAKIFPQLLMGIGILAFAAGAVWYFNLPKPPVVAGGPLTDMEKSRRNFALMMIRENTSRNIQTKRRREYWQGWTIHRQPI